jgi:NAD(P)H-hydrate epimerase
MRITLARSQVREIDRRAIQEYGISGLVLMENAGRGTADVMCGLLGSEHSDRKKVVIVCGKGNNGGDGFVIARHLDLRGITVRVLMLADPKDLTGDAATNFRIIEKAGLRIVPFAESELAGATWLVDAILGTGAIGEPKSPLAEAIDAMNASGVPILAVDLPSGLDCDTGAAAKHTIRAAHTCTFVAAKPGFFAAGAQQYVGQLHVLDIGAPRKLVEEISSPQRRGDPERQTN